MSSTRDERRSVAEGRRVDSSPVERVVVERIVAPIPVGWKIRFETPDGPIRRWVLDARAWKRDLEEAGWEVRDHVAGFAASAPDRVVDGARMGPRALPRTIAIADGFDAAVDAVSEALERGGLAVIPTDTVYGLVGALHAPGVVARIAASKGRAPDHPMAVLIGSFDQAQQLAEWTDPIERVAHTVWPGAATLVVARRDGVTVDLGGDVQTIGLRLPADALCRAVTQRVGPIVATSANRTGDPPAVHARDAVSVLSDIEVVIDGGELSADASTVLDLTGHSVAVLRAGPVDPGVAGRAFGGDPDDPDTLGG